MSDTARIAATALRFAVAELNSGNAAEATESLALYRAERARLAVEPYTGADEDAAELASELGL